MSLFPNLSESLGVIPVRRSHVNGGTTHDSRKLCLMLACVLTSASWISAASAYGQLPSSSISEQGSTSSQSGASNSASAMSGQSASSQQDNTSSLSLNSFNSRAALPADQIIRILEQNPDLATELKSELADRLQQQGVQADPDGISDQMLYGQIAANSSLRINVTAVLRARGYISDDDLRLARSSSAGEDATGLQSRPNDDASESKAEENLSADASQSRLTGDANTASALQSMRAEHGRNKLPDNPRGEEEANASTDLPKVEHRPTPYNTQSLHDIYAQIPSGTPGLKRFGSDVFVRRDVSEIGAAAFARNTPLDVPLGPDYVVGPGDILSIDIWGGVTQHMTRAVGRDGRALLPEAGSVNLAGLTLGKAQEVIAAELQRQYRNAQVAVTISSLRSIRIYIVGDVQRPGGYDISALATPVSALYAAGGPTAVGSLRTLLHYRGKQLVEKIDLYDFLLHGIRNGSASFESGDTLLVPPAGPQVAVFGAIKRPAIYELKEGETTLSTLIGDAGGFTSAASLNHIRIERIDANQQRVTITLPGKSEEDLLANQNAIDSFPVKDGDRIRIEPILPYSQRAVYLAGHVVRPGRLPYSEGMRLSDVLRSYRDMLPEPDDRGEIVRLVSPDLHAEAIEFNVPDVLIGNANVTLRPFDTIRIFGRYQEDAPMVTVRGEVLRPGRYPMSKGMTAAQLVRMAGGFKRDAMRETADLTSYKVENGSRIVENLATVRIEAALSGNNPDADVLLKPGDILSIHQITNWNDIGESITIKGQVRFPGSYGFMDGERLSSVLLRAGGMLPTAYPAGAVLIRDQVRDLELKSRDELVRQIEANSAAARLSPAMAGSNAAGTLQLIKSQQDQVLAELKSHDPSGRMVIHITADIGSWANSPADIELRQGDMLIIPKRPGFVLVTGQVYNATALTYTPDKTAKWYLSHAGGANAAANQKEIFIIRANGSVVGRRSGGWFDGDVLSTKLNPGDVVVVPQKIIGGSLFWRNLLAAGQIAASAAITAGVAVATL
jgi:protein involved in polysaccharide export with SLBB domain